MTEDRKNKYITGAFFLLFGLTMVFLFWKCPYGYAHEDEPLALTIPYRMCLGDCLLTQEWHLSQLSCFPLYPTMKLYLAVFGGTTGMVLHFRYLYTLVWGMAACFFFFRLRRFSRIGALLSSLSFLLYAPFGIMTLDYNSMGILFLLNAGVIAAAQRNGKALPLAVSGLFFAGAVLCCPYLLLLYALLTLAAFGAALRKKTELLRGWLYFSLGCAVLLGVFCLYLFTHTTLSELLRVLPELFRDPEHTGRGAVRLVGEYVREILLCNRVFGPAFLVYLGVTAFSLRRGKKELGFILNSLLCVLIQADFLWEKPYLNFVMFPINLLGLYCALCTKKPEARIPFYAIWLPGGVYTFCIHMASNQKFYAISSAAAVMTAASLIIIAVFVEECRTGAAAGKYRLAVLLSAALLFTLQLLPEALLRYRSVFAEMGMEYQTAVAVDGPEKGIRMTPDHCRYYEQLEEDIREIRARGDVRKILFFADVTHAYLSAETECAAYSSWLSGINRNSLARLDRYYELFPDKQPDGIYFDETSARYAEHFLDRGYEASPLGSGALLLTRESVP